MHLTKTPGQSLDGRCSPSISLSKQRISWLEDVFSTPLSLEILCLTLYSREDGDVTRAFCDPMRKGSWLLHGIEPLWWGCGTMMTLRWHEARLQKYHPTEKCIRWNFYRLLLKLQREAIRTKKMHCLQSLKLTTNLSKCTVCTLYLYGKLIRVSREYSVIR